MTQEIIPAFNSSAEYQKGFHGNLLYNYITEGKALSMAHAAQLMGISLRRLKAWTAKFPELRDVYEWCETYLQADAERILLRAARGGDTKALTLYMRSQFQEYIEKKHIDTNPGNFDNMPPDKLMEILKTKLLQLSPAQRETILPALLPGKVEFDGQQA